MQQQQGYNPTIQALHRGIFAERPVSTTECSQRGYRAACQCQDVCLICTFSQRGTSFGHVRHVDFRHSLALWPMLPGIPAQNRGEGFLAKPEHWTSQDLLQQCSSMLSRLISVSGCSSSWNSQGSVAMP